MLFELTRPVRQALANHIVVDEVQDWLKLSSRPDGSYGETWLVLTPRYFLIGDAPSHAAPSFQKHLREEVIAAEVIEEGSAYLAAIRLRSGAHRDLPLRWVDKQGFDEFATKLTAGASSAGGEAPVATPGDDAARSSPSAMPCLKCGHWSDVVTLDGVEVERCPRCEGIYLDRNELDELTGASGLTARLAKDTSRCHACHCTIPDDADRCPACQSELPPFSCPKCTSVMRHVIVGDVVMELCTSCHGIWLDAGELEEVRRYTLAQGVARQAAPAAPAPASTAQTEAPRALPAEPDINTIGPGVTCLRCDVPASVERMGEVEVDLCHRCGGLFLDRGELEQLTGIEGLGAQLLESDQRCPACLCMLDPSATSCLACGKELPQPSCPRCHETMRHVLGGEIMLEHCLACGGLWLDRGELNKIEDWLRDHATPRDEPAHCARCAIPLHDPGQGYFSGDGVVCHRCIVEIDVDDSQRFRAEAERAGGRILFGRPHALGAVWQLISWFRERDSRW